MKDSIPRVAVQRLPIYLRCLTDLGPGDAHISSEELAARAGVNSAKVRKDLSYLGSYGTRGVGYDAEHLAFQIRRVLGLTRVWNVVIVGAGNLGRALANYAGFAEQGFHLVGLFDVDPSIEGESIDGLTIEPMEAMSAAIGERGAVIGVITVPASAAQNVADLLAESGIRSILNFAPSVIKVPEGIEVRRVNFSTELQVLSFYLHRTAPPAR